MTSGCRASCSFVRGPKPVELPRGGRRASLVLCLLAFPARVLSSATQKPPLESHAREDEVEATFVDAEATRGRCLSWPVSSPEDPMKEIDVFGWWDSMGQTRSVHGLPSIFHMCFSLEGVPNAFS